MVARIGEEILQSQENNITAVLCTLSDGAPRPLKKKNWELRSTKSARKIL